MNTIRRKQDARNDIPPVHIRRYENGVSVLLYTGRRFVLRAGDFEEHEQILQLGGLDQKEKIQLENVLFHCNLHDPVAFREFLFERGRHVFVALADQDP